ncbi:MAG: hypothetical protein K2O17_05265 [Bacteroidaceae bacterium]|nr:hypothetical protein [Bacteroidaceae bacterium]
MKLMDKLKGGSVKSLFATKPESIDADSETAFQSVSQTGTYAREEGETYKQYGFRVAGLSAGNFHTLLPCLQSVYLSIRKEQESDAILQDALINKLDIKKAELEAECQNKKNEIEESQGQQKRLLAENEELKEEFATLKHGIKERNRDAWITLVLSSTLLVPFSIYFFIFYSSVGYSAFFMQFNLNDINDIYSQIVFDPQAIPNAWKDGFAELLFILLMPVIFLAFGFVLNRWEREKGWLKYIKIPALIIVAFVFDSLLSFGICKKIYEVVIITRESDFPPYSLSLAFEDPTFWVIICLGFVSYLIWGFVFGFWVKAWENLDLNLEKRKRLENKIENTKKKLEAEHQNCLRLKAEMASIGPKIKEVESQMGVSARYDIGKIKLELNNFFAGWQTYLAVLGKPNSAKQHATDIFNGMIASI